MRNALVQFSCTGTSEKGNSHAATQLLAGAALSTPTAHMLVCSVACRPLFLPPTDILYMNHVCTVPTSRNSTLATLNAVPLVEAHPSEYFRLPALLYGTLRLCLPYPNLNATIQSPATLRRASTAAVLLLVV